ncbi:MEKHLA domain protein [mine drainage metagenome]|uniref:MEKHLA domain protein n=1 Tax=mine drainage metagenome TaxID=410659 RepID=A0A1J5QJN0_9ZZZZ
MTPDAVWLARHIRLMRASHRHWTGQDLLPAGLDGTQAVEALDAAGFALISHGTQPDPIFNYANAAALQLFDMSWQAFTKLPSRLSAEPLLQADRDHLLARVAELGYIDDYTGVRISGSGRRFRIRNATVWNLVDESGRPYGQAALLREWQALD